MYLFGLGSFLISVFYVFKEIRDLKAAHLAVALLAVSPFFTTFPWEHGGHFSGHLAVFSVVGWALWATVVAWKNPQPIRFVAAGLFWGLTFLSRYESVLDFIACWLVTAWTLRGSLSKEKWIKNLLLFLGCFLLAYLPKDLYYRHAANKYDIIADNAIYTFYTGEMHSRAGGIVGNGDNLGWIESQKVYGTIEENHGSLIYLILHHPGPVLKRIQQNILTAWPQFYKNNMFYSKICLFFILFLFHPKAKPYRRLALLFLALHLSTYSILLFHVDLRYLTITAIYLYFLFALGWIIFIGEALKGDLRRRSIVTMAALFVLAYCFRFNVYRPKGQIGSEYVFPADGFEPIRKYFSSLDRSNPPVVYADIAGRDLFLLLFYFSYYTDTAINWVFQGPFPLDKMAAISSKKLDYYVVSEGSLINYPKFSPSKSVFSIKTLPYGTLYVFHANEGTS